MSPSQLSADRFLVVNFDGQALYLCGAPGREWICALSTEAAQAKLAPGSNAPIPRLTLAGSKRWYAARHKAAQAQGGGWFTGPKYPRWLKLICTRT